MLVRSCSPMAKLYYMCLKIELLKCNLSILVVSLSGLANAARLMQPWDVSEGDTSPRLQGCALSPGLASGSTMCGGGTILLT